MLYPWKKEQRSVCLLTLGLSWPMIVGHRITVGPLQTLVLALQLEPSVARFGHVLSLEDKHVFQFCIHSRSLPLFQESDECLGVVRKRIANEWQTEYRNETLIYSRLAITDYFCMKSSNKTVKTEYSVIQSKRVKISVNKNSSTLMNIQVILVQISVLRRHST